MIVVYPSPTADTRTCDFATVTKERLEASSRQHMRDVMAALNFFTQEIAQAMHRHDTDKITDLDGFHADFVTGFTQHAWWDRHLKLNRHHLNDAEGVPEDVNLIDVLDYVADCVMSGMARSGTVYPVTLPPEILARALQNTVELLKQQIVIPEGRWEGR
jgi:hypothetical protein